MTNEEKQEIVNAVLAALRTNSKTITQLTTVNSMSDGDYIELSGGRKASYATFIAGLTTAAQLQAAGDYLDGKKVDKDAHGLVECHQARVVYLDGMGEIDGGDTTLTGGRIVYRSDTKYIYDGDGSFSSPNQHAVYISKVNGIAYVWDGTDMVPISDNMRSRQIIDFINTPTVTFDDMAIGTMYYVSSSKKLAVKINESGTATFEPNPNIIYYARDARNIYVWNAGTQSWQLF